MILVLGGTGKTGRRVAERLIARGESVRIGSRGASPPFDWGNPDTWADAIAGVDTVYITFQPDLAVPGARELVERFVAQAVEAGVRKLVLLSGKGEVEAQRAERVVMDSGAEWTIVRASWFNQNFSESFFLDPILAGHVSLPRSDSRVPYVDADDIADVVVEALVDPAHAGQIYQLTGPRQWTFPEITAEIAKAAGREIAFTPISMDEYEQMLREFQVPDDYIWLITYLFTEVLTPENDAVTGDVRKVLGREPRDFTDYARDTAKTGVWNPPAPRAPDDGREHAAAG